MIDAKTRKRLRERGRLMGETMASDPETLPLLEGILTCAPTNDGLPSKRGFFWSGFICGAFVASLVWVLLTVLHI